MGFSGGEGSGGSRRAWTDAQLPDGAPERRGELRRGMAPLENSGAGQHKRSGSTAATRAKNSHLPRGQTKLRLIQHP